MSIESARRGWRGAIAIYAQPRVRALLFLGFSAGLPFLLVFSTLSAWLTQAGVSRTTIGYFSWVGITYSTKLFLAPVVDRVPLPLLTRWIGRRRRWIDRKSTRLNSSHSCATRTPPSAGKKKQYTQTDITT